MGTMRSLFTAEASHHLSRDVEHDIAKGYALDTALCLAIVRGKAQRVSDRYQFVAAILIGDILCGVLALAPQVLRKGFAALCTLFRPLVYTLLAAASVMSLSVFE